MALVDRYVVRSPRGSGLDELARGFTTNRFSNSIHGAWPSLPLKPEYADGTLPTFGTTRAIPRPNRSTYRVLRNLQEVWSFL